MADITFDQFLEEQKKTNDLLKKQKSPLDGRTSAGKALLDTQKETTVAITDKLDELNKDQPDPPKSAAGDEEDEKDTESKENMRFGKLGDIFKNQIGKVTGAIAGIVGKTKAPLLAALTAAGMFALATFLESDTWKNIRKIIIEDLPPLLDKLYKDFIKPTYDFFKGKFLDLWEDLKAFLEDPSFSTLGTLIGENKIALLALLALLAPGLLLKGLKLGFEALKLGYNNLGKATNLLAKGLKGSVKSLQFLGKKGMAPWKISFTSMKESFKNIGTNLGASVKSLKGKVLDGAKSMKSGLIKIGAQLKLAAIPLLAGALVFAGIVVAFMAIKDAIDVFNSDANEGLSLTEKLGIAAATFFVRLFQIPAEILASFIPEEWKEKWNLAIADTIDASVGFFSTLGTKWQDNVITPIVDGLFATSEWISEKVGQINDFLDLYVFEPLNAFFQIISDFFNNLIAPFAAAVKAFQSADGLIAGAKAAFGALFGGGGGDGGEVDEGQTEPVLSNIGGAAGASDAARLRRLREQLKDNPEASEMYRGKTLERIKDLEKKLARQSAGGGAGAIAINQDNSVKQNSQTTRAENIILEDREMAGAVAAGPA